MAKRVFLCLTDLHYSDDQVNFTDDPKELGKPFGGAFRADTLQRLNAILEHGFEPNELDFIAVVGDITTHGQEVGLSQFCKEAVPLLEPLVPENAICIVPGNHDVMWALDPSQPGYFQLKFQHFVEMVNEANATTCLFPKGEVKPDSHSKVVFQRPKHGPLYINDDESKQILVLNINSASRCGELHKEMHEAFVQWSGKAIDLGPKATTTAADKSKAISKYFLRDIAQFTQDQLEPLQDILKRQKKHLGDKWNSYLKVALVHHHVVHFPGQETEHKGYEFMLDSSLLLEFLTGFDFDLILTGHKHHAYEMVHHFRDKEIFIVGGSTMGGHQSAGSFRGIRLIEFDNTQSSKRLKIKNVTHDLSTADVREAIKRITPIPLEINLSPADALKRSVQREGFSYRNIVATTKITDEGDAIRTVQCDALLISRQCERAVGHVVVLPLTSGYIDHFRASSPDLDIDVEDEGATSVRAKSATKRLSFRPKLSLGCPINYQFEWTAVNAFALDKTQFKRMYPKDTALQNTEFTHFQPKDPAETMILMVQFPSGFAYREIPHIRVAKPDPTVEDSRLWQLDEDTTEALKAAHAMTVIPSINTIELRVATPDPNLSYGIEWKLPEGPVRRDSGRIPRLIRSLEPKSPLSPTILYRTLSGVRRILLKGWAGEFDMNLMVFGFSQYPGMLKSISAGRFTQLVDGAEPKSMDEIPTDVTIPYGLGIAGRAFKANRPQFHVSPEIALDGSGLDSPSFYLRFPGSLDHKKLICIPLHLPVQQREFQKESNVYATSEPYGILNIGSENEEFPLSPELVSEDRTEAELKMLQHSLNVAMAEVLFDIRSTVQKMRKSGAKTGLKPGD